MGRWSDIMAQAAQNIGHIIRKLKGDDVQEMPNRPYLDFAGNCNVETTEESIRVTIPEVPAGQVSVGDTTTLPAGQVAAVTQRGTPEHRILDFAIPRGPQGDPGPQGIAATITVGETKQVEPGHPAHVYNVGTYQDAILDFCIPKGEKGDQGDAARVTVKQTNMIPWNQPAKVRNVGTTGDAQLIFDIPWGRAATVAIGKVTKVLPEADATVINVGTPEVAVLDFGIPQGKAATIKVGNVTTVPYDQDATVTNVGDTGSAVFDFEIPHGRESTISVGSISVLKSDQLPTVTNSGTNIDAVLDFGIPQGKAATVTIGDVVKVLPEADATVTNTGTAEDAVLNFEIPQGKAATIEIGNVTTVPYDQDAKVTNTGDTGSAVFDFEIPHGRESTITVGNVTTVTNDKPATVSNSGTSIDAVLDFELPQGKAASIKVGKTETLEPNTPATVANSGTDEDAVLDFGIPNGKAATVTVGSVTTLQPGSSATVENVGTNTDAIFNFGIPAGDPYAQITPVEFGGTGAATEQEMRDNFDLMTSTEIASAISAAIESLRNGVFNVVETLPDSGDVAKIYLVKDGSEAQNTYQEYIYVNDAWERLGPATLDLSSYSLKGETVSSLSASGRTVTYQKADGTSGSFTTQDTTYSAGTGLSLNNTTFNLTNTGVTADSYGPSADATLAHSGTFKVPTITVDSNGRITGAANITFTLPAQYVHPSYSARNTGQKSDASPGFGGTFYVGNILNDSTGHIYDSYNRTITMPSSVATTTANGLMSSGDKSKLDGVQTGATAVSFTRSLTAGTQIGTLTINGTEYVLYCQTNTNTDTLVTANLTSSGERPILLRTTTSASSSSITANAYYTSAVKVNAQTGTLTATTLNATNYSGGTATASAPGLMSAADKSKLDGVQAGATQVTVTRNLTSGTKIGTITVNGTNYELYCQTNTDTDTHWTSHLYAGASGATANAATSNGGTYLSICDNSTSRNSIKITGSGATTVSSNANGVITIAATDKYVEQTPSTTNTSYPILLRAGSSTTTSTINVAYFSAKATLNASTGAMTVGSLTSNGNITATSNLIVNGASGTTSEGGQITLNAGPSGTTYNGIELDQYNGTFRIFGRASADGKTKTGSGTPLIIDPYAKTITGGYTITGSLNGNATSATKATQDGSGNTITSKYVTVDTAQTISGNKTFSGVVAITRVPTITEGIELKAESTSANHGGYVDFHYNQDTSNYTARIIEGQKGRITIFNKLQINNTEAYGNNTMIEIGVKGSDGTQYYHDFLRAVSQNASYGANIAIGAGGNAIIGSGESYNSLMNDLVSDVGEEMYVTSDNGIHFIVNGNTWANRRIIDLTNGGILTNLACVYLKNAASPILRFATNGLAKGTNPSGNLYQSIIFGDNTDNNGNAYRAGLVECAMNSAGLVTMSMLAYNWTKDATNNGGIKVHYPKGGTPYTETLTPAAGDNSTKIATTAYVIAALTNTGLNNYVRQTVSTADRLCPVLTRNTTATTTGTGDAYFNAGVFINHSKQNVLAKQYLGKNNALSSAASVSINVCNGATATLTVTVNTTISFTGVNSGYAACFTLILTNGGNYTVTWPSTVKWSDGSAPDLTKSGIDVLTFLTPNNGGVWYGAQSVAAAA